MFGDCYVYPGSRLIGLFIAAMLLVGCAAPQASAPPTAATTPGNQRIPGRCRVEPRHGGGCQPCEYTASGQTVRPVGEVREKALQLIGALDATQRPLPLGSAVVVTVLGLVISAKGVLAYLS